MDNLSSLSVYHKAREIHLQVSESADKRRLEAKKREFERDLQGYMQDYINGYLSEEELDEIVKDYNSRDGRISVAQTRHLRTEE